MAILIIAGAGVLFLFILLTIIPVGLWISAIAAGVRVSLISLVAMRLRRVPPNKIIIELIKAVKAGLDLKQDALEAHYLAGGNVVGVVDAIIAADKAHISLPFSQAAAIDLAGRDVLDAIKTSVVPRVIHAPNISAVAKDGIEVISTAWVTVRTNIERLVGGAGEETIIARVGEGIVSSIGSATSYKLVLESPDTISKTVLEKGLDSGTAFNILSIDIADMSVGRNIGAVLQTDQAEADKRVSQARAEERRAMAVAAEQEMRAKVEEMHALVVEAQVEVPQAVAQAFREGHLTVASQSKLQRRS